jgi:hypothetical protein
MVEAMREKNNVSMDLGVADLTLVTLPEIQVSVSLLLATTVIIAMMMMILLAIVLKLLVGGPAF